MKSIYALLLALACFFGAERAAAQCQYRLEMYDSYGDGWNGGQLGIFAGSLAYVFTLNDLDDDGSDSTTYFTVEAGQQLRLIWAPGLFSTEVSFDVFDDDGLLVASEADPAAGIIFDGTAHCPKCLTPANFHVENTWHDRARLRWEPLASAPAASWTLVYGLANFTLGQPGEGDTLTVFQPKATLSGLAEMTAYDVYLTQNCDATDTSRTIGPLRFKTYWSDDVGISAVNAPRSGCDLGNEKVQVLLKNAGANPQSLVPFFYAVNGQKVNIPYPIDGFYTGVLGKDSCEFIAFETRYDFSKPGEYLIEAWTELDGDDDTSNDTIRYYVNNRLEAPYQQNFETWNGGWAADDTLSAASSWAFGLPAGDVITAAHSGQSAWVTNLAGPHNNNERSYLNSPCFDFSALTTDPYIEFYANRNIEPEYDGAWLDASTDDGATWQKIGAQGEGYNWYTEENLNTGLGEVWSGTSDGWVKTRHELTGVAGKTGVRVRFALGSDEDTAGEGFGVDDVEIRAAESRDLFGDVVSTTAEGSACGLAKDTVRFTVANFGSQPASNFQLAYSVNGGPAVVEPLIGLTLLPEDRYEHTFLATFDSRDGLFQIRCWTLLSGDGRASNDTAHYIIDHRPLPVPLAEDFETRVVPAGWSVTGGTVVTEEHANLSNVLSFNLFDFEPEFIFEIPRYGLISVGDSLAFDYRITDYDSDGTLGTDLNTAGSIEVQISTDCGGAWQTIYTLDGTTHTPDADLQRLQLDLSAFAGQGVSIRFVGAWADGDYFFDLDNVNILACPAGGLPLTVNVVPPTPDHANGAATVTATLGTPPFEYLWSTGADTQTATNLAEETYTVTVTDARGCSGTLEIEVGTSASTGIEGLRRLVVQPNPTSGLATLRLELDRPLDVHLQATNLLGMSIFEKSIANATSLAEPLDFASQPDGIYLVRLRAGARVQTLRVAKTSRR